MTLNPLLDETGKPSMESLEIFLGPRRFHNLNKIYKEMVDLGYTANLEWSKNDNTWLFRYYRNGSAIFDLRVGNNHFYTEIHLASDDYLKITRFAEITELASRLVHKYPENRARKMVWVKADLDNMSDQEGFFDLLPLLARVMPG